MYYTVKLYTYKSNIKLIDEIDHNSFGCVASPLFFRIWNLVKNGQWTQISGKGESPDHGNGDESPLLKTSALIFMGRLLWCAIFCFQVAYRWRNSARWQLQPTCKLRRTLRLVEDRPPLCTLLVPGANNGLVHLTKLVEYIPHFYKFFFEH